MCFSGGDVVILNSLLGDRLVIAKTDDLIQSYESLSTSTSPSQGQIYLVVYASVIRSFACRLLNLIFLSKSVCNRVVQYVNDDDDDDDGIFCMMSLCLFRLEAVDLSGRTASFSNSPQQFIFALGTDLISLLILMLLFFLVTSLKKPNRIRVKFGSTVLQLNMHKLIESDFWYDDII